MLALHILGLVICCIIIWKACDLFEVAGDYFGQHLSGGLKGMTINAISSSLPELMSTFVALLILGNLEGFVLGISLTAGSAVFNSLLIPALCILIAIYYTNEDVLVSKKTVYRDGLWLLGCEAIFIWLLSGQSLNYMTGLLLMSMYLAYVTYSLVTMTPEDSEPVEGSTIKSSAFLALSIAIMTAACYALVYCCEHVGDALGWSVMAAGLLLAAVATSVPDCVISVRDSLRGEHEDAISNALGSNIFDICFALGLPLACYTWMHGPIKLSGEIVEQSFQLRVMLLILTAMAAGVFVSGKRVEDKIRLTNVHGYTLVGLYCSFIGAVSYLYIF